MSSNLCGRKWHALYRIENSSEITEATNGQQCRSKVCQVSYLLGSTVPSTAQGHLRTNRTFTILPHQLKNTSQSQSPFFHTSWKTPVRQSQSPFFHTSWKTPVRQSQGKWWIPVLTPVNIKRYQVTKRSVKISQFLQLTTTDRSVTVKLGNCDARQVGCAN